MYILFLGHWTLLHTPCNKKLEQGFFPDRLTHTTAFRVNHSGLTDYRKKSVKFVVQTKNVMSNGLDRLAGRLAPVTGVLKKQRNEEFGVFSNLNLKTKTKENIFKIFQDASNGVKKFQILMHLVFFASIRSSTGFVELLMPAKYTE
jgi:hypothetical protein